MTQSLSLHHCVFFSTCDLIPLDESVTQGQYATVITAFK